MNLSFKTLAHAVMIAFAGASLGNVRAFLVTAGHPVEVAWALGIALGAALVTVSIMLSHLDRRADASAWLWLLATGCLLGGVSGAVQAAEYARHLPMGWAILLGFSIPLGGEVLLALGVSSYGRARERERFRNVAALVEGAVVSRLEDAIGSLDAEAIHKHVERTITGLARQAVTNVAAQASAFYSMSNVQSDDVQRSMIDVQPPLNVKTPQSNVVNVESVPNQTTALDKANAERQQTIEQRRVTVLNILRSVGSASVAQIAEQLGDNAPSRGTLTTDLNALADDGRVFNQDRKWHVLSATIAIPDPVIATNGHSKAEAHT